MQGRNTQVQSFAGFSLLEFIISVGILGVLVAVVVSVISGLQKTSKVLEKKAAVQGLSVELKNALLYEEVCKANFKKIVDNAKLKLNDLATYKDPPALDLVDGIRYFDRKNINVELKSIVSPNAVFDGYKVKQLTFAPQTLAGQNRSIFKLSLETQATSGSLAVQPFEDIPIFVISDSLGRFVSCSTNGAILDSKICSLLNKGDYKVDPVTGECTPLPLKCYPGTRDKASCPAGQKIANEGYQSCISTAIDPANVADQVVRSYTNDFNSSYPRPYKCIRLGSTNSAQCLYALDFDSSASICSACCLSTDETP